VKADLYLLDFRKFTKDPLIDNNTIKVNIFVAKFFPKTKIVDFGNIKTTIEQRVFNISPIILAKKLINQLKAF